MCGGGAFSYSPPKPVMQGWYKWWQGIYSAMPSEDVGLFIELVRGCNQVSCVYQCQARNLPMKLMTVKEFYFICGFLNKVSHNNIMLYGMGDSGLWTWDEWFKVKQREVILPDGRINLSPLTDKDTIRRLSRNNVKPYFTPQNVEETIICNTLRETLGCQLGGVIIPVKRNVDWLEMAKILFLGRLRVEFNSYTPSSDSKYISAEEFNNVMNAHGLNVQAKEYKLKPGFKPVIEGCEGTEIRMRRCFQLDSAKFQFTFNSQKDWEKTENKALYDGLVEFAKSETTCVKCSDVAWKWNT